jgi:CRP-like cAMP-binding protein
LEPESAGISLLSVSPAIAPTVEEAVQPIADTAAITRAASNSLAEDGRFSCRTKRQAVTRGSFVADGKLIRALEKLSQPILCFEDRILFSQGEDPIGLFILQTGEAVLKMHAESRNIVMRLMISAGSLLGLPGVIGNEPYTLTAMARKGSEVGFVTRLDFEELLSAELSLYPEILLLLATEVRAAHRALAEV